MQPSILSGSIASYANKFRRADLPQQNSKRTNALNNTGKEKEKAKLKC